MRRARGHQVGRADDPHEVAGRVHDRQPADPIALEQLLRVADRSELVDDDRVQRHEVGDAEVG